jgi:hypothetical protein
MDTYTKPGDGHAIRTWISAWTGTCCSSMFKFILHVHFHAACPYPCWMSMSILHVPVYAACYFHAACLCLCCVFMSVLNGFEQAVWTRTCSMDIDILLRHGDEAWTWACTMDKCVQCTCCMSMSILHIHVHAACPSTCFVSMPMLHAVSMLHLQYALLHGHEHTTRTWTCSMDKDLQHGR